MSLFADATSPHGAVLSPDGRHRYRLWRHVSPRPRRMLFVMLNPSTADAETDDPTIRRCRGFAEREDCGRFDVVNLFAFRSVDPAALARVPDPVGRDNDVWISQAAADADLIVLAWGAPGERWRTRTREVQALLASHATHCLGRTVAGQPRHPLMLRGDTPLASWSQPSASSETSCPST